MLAALALPLTLTAAPALAASNGVLPATGLAAAPRAAVTTVATLGTVWAGTVPAAPGRLKAPAKPTGVTISGAGLTAPITVLAAEEPGLFKSLEGQVSWLRTEPGQTTEPAADQRGPQYKLALLVNNKSVGVFDLYPLATGGARVYRPANQPDRRKTEAGWFFGRLNMSETLRIAGAPLPERPDVVNGGIGGGERVNSQEMLDTREDINRLLAQLRQVLLLNAGILLVITAGLAGMSLLIRRKI